MSNYGELVANVIEHQFNPTKFTPSVKRWLNEAQNKVALRITLRDLFTPTEFETVIGEDAYELPPDFLRIAKNGIADATNPTDWVTCSEMSLRDFDEFPTISGAPRNYVIAGNVLYLYPQPDVVYDIALLYWRKVEPMVNDSDVPEIPEEFHDLLEYYALKRCYEREHDTEMAQYHENQYRTELERAAGQAQYDTKDAVRIVPGTWGDTGGGGTGGGGGGVGGGASDEGGGGDGGGGPDTFGGGSFGEGGFG